MISIKEALFQAKDRYTTRQLVDGEMVEIATFTMTDTDYIRRGISVQRDVRVSVMRKMDKRQFAVHFDSYGVHISTRVNRESSQWILKEVKVWAQTMTKKRNAIHHLKHALRKQHFNTTEAIFS